ncbi:MAG TPA: hypothetical protein VNB50_09955, partial [Gaiellaceae bacterium]|nr:hypothetical protein [Gaiellaceae bacterium]
QSTGDLASGATQPLVESAAGVADPLVQSTGDLASGATQPLVDVTDPLVQSTAGTLDSATGATQPLVDSAAGVTDPLVQSTAGTLGSATAAAQPLVDTAAGVTDPLVQSTADLASGATQPLVEGAAVTDPLVQSTGDLASGATRPLVETTAGVTDRLVHDPLTVAVAGAPDPALASAGPNVATAWPMLPVAQPAKATSPSPVDGGFAGELPIDLAAVGAAVGSFEGRMLLTGAVMLAVTARVAGSDWGLTPMLNTCGQSVRMSFEAMRLIPCQSAQALRSVAAPALRGFSFGKDAGSAVATTSTSARQSADVHRGGALRMPHAPSWPVPLAGTALVRMFAVVVAAASAVMALVCGTKDEVEQRRRHEYRGRLHS